MPDGPTTQAPAPTPTPDPSSQIDQQLQQLMARTMQPRSSIAVPTPQQGPRIPYEGGPAVSRAEGTQLFFHNLGATIGNAVQQHKEKQIKDATGVLQTLHDAWEKAQDMAGGDQEKAKQIYNQLPSVQSVLGDPKKLKQLAKLSSWDAMNPEKANTVYHEAAKRVGQAGRMSDTMKGIRSAIDNYQRQRQQQTMEAHMAPQPPDIKGATEIAKTEAELTKARADMTKAQADIKLKFDFRPNAQGDMMAYDKTTGKGAPIVDDKGKPLTAAVKAGAGEGKVASVGGVPFGIYHTGPDGKPTIVTPGDDAWTPADAKVFEASKAAAATGEANKAKLADKRATFFSSLPQAVMSKVDDPQKGIKAGELAFVTRQEAGANPAKYAPVGSGDKALGMQARFGEIQRTVDMTNTAIANLPDTGFDKEARAQLAYVLRAPDPASALDGFFKSSAATTLTDAQIDYVTSLASLAESAQAMTSLQGIGARGSDKLRASIVAMLPGAGTPSKKYAEVQMKKFQVELDALRKGVPSLGALSGADTAPAGTTSFTDAGVTYDIPREKIAAFKKAHPNATTAR